jgi:heterodisulfide reductase subunit A
VVASCTPRTHAPLFQDSLRAAGLNPNLFDMANIRNQCSWVHSYDRLAATAKARDLVRMAVGRVARLEPLTTSQVPVEPAALVIGGGAAGMTAALTLAQGGFAVHLVEREAELGGNLRRVFEPLDGRDPQTLLSDLLKRILDEPRIQVHLGSGVAETTGFVGNFTSRLIGSSGASAEVRHGVTIVATGGQEYRGSEHLYGASPRVLTGLEMEGLLAFAEGKAGATEEKSLAAWEALGGRLPDEVAMVLCVGPAERYCGRICCTTALKNAVWLKRLNPAARVTILYKDLRAYGFKERLYTEARRQGVVFIRYDDENRPQVSQDDGRLHIEVQDPSLRCRLHLEPDLLMLSTPPVPSEGSAALARAFKLPVDGDGFFLEVHVKLRPVDFATEGVFMAGLAHYPKLAEEAVIQAKAAATRAARVLAQPSLTVGGVVAQVDPEKCVGCLTCVRVCPFNVPKVVATAVGVGGIVGAATIEPTTCRGCGSCVAECPAKAIQLAHYRDDQIMVKLEAMVAEAGVEHA